MILQGILRVLKAYKRYLSPLIPQQCQCRFTPTCSEYAMDAFEYHGIILGSLLTTFRLLRCQPFSYGGFDPVYLRSENSPNPSKNAETLLF